MTINRKYLVCVDSDGCAIDSMNVKHYKCFGPAAVSAWGIEAQQDAFLKRWNEINLYSTSRGINRFLGLAIIAEEYALSGWQSIKNWTQTTAALSNEALSGETDEALVKLLRWSHKVNEAIEALDMPKPFAGVFETLQFLSGDAEIAVVSSANLAAIEKEWTAGGLLQNISTIMSQNDGSKSNCIAQLINKDYLPQNILMIGDSPGDYTAATENGVCFYPIVPGKEAESWAQLKNKAWDEFKTGKLNESYIIDFNDTLKCE